jgi:hypothetical protein
LVSRAHVILLSLFLSLLLSLAHSEFVHSSVNLSW